MQSDLERRRLHAVTTRPLPLACCVYGLSAEDADGAPRFFFVGGLRRERGFDVPEHVAALRGMQPVLAGHLARLEAAGLRHGYAVLRECADDEAHEGLPAEPLLRDAIRFETIRLLRENHPLINQHLGTVDERHALLVDVAGAAIQCPRDLARRRVLLARRAAARSSRARTLRMLASAWRCGSDDVSRLLRLALPALAQRLARCSVLAWPPPGTEPAQALRMMMAQARRAAPGAVQREISELAARPKTRRGRPAGMRI